MAKRIGFYEPEEAYGWLTALSAHPIEMEGVVWPTAEHFYQAQKFAEPALQEKIRLTADARAAKEMARELAGKGLRRDGWAGVKVSVMEQALRAKFNQHPQLADKLVGTGDVELVEMAPDDRFWGRDADGRGDNRLGELLMRLRADLAVERNQERKI